MKITVVEGDLLDQDVDVIVNAWNSAQVGVAYGMAWQAIAAAGAPEAAGLGCCVNKTPAISRTRITQRDCRFPTGRLRPDRPPARPIAYPAAVWDGSAGRTL